MDGMRFDAWTRRRLGLAASGIAATVIGMTTPAAAGKNRKNRKNRCRKILDTCSTTPSAQSCCGGLNCDIVGTAGLRCCLGLRAPCEPANNRCCSRFQCAQPTSPTEFACCSKAGDPCEGDEDCCSDICNGGLCESG